MKYQIIRGTTEEFPYGVNIKDSSGSVIQLITANLGELTALLQKLDGLEFFPTSVRYANLVMLNLRDVDCISLGEVEPSLIAFAWDTHGIRNDAAVEDLWKEFKMIPTDEEGNLEMDFMVWNKGTYRFDVAYWFDKYHSDGVRGAAGKKYK